MKLRHVEQSKGFQHSGAERKQGVVNGSRLSNVGANSDSAAKADLNTPSMAGVAVLSAFKPGKVVLLGASCWKGQVLCSRDEVYCCLQVCQCKKGSSIAAPSTSL